MILLVAASVWRRRLRVSHEVWHIGPSVPAVVAVMGALVHVYLVSEWPGVDSYVGTLWKLDLGTKAFVDGPYLD
jgi:hypothetical protein